MEFLELRRLRTHNLKDFDLKIPLYKLVLITGPSGAGKSSLAFDTLAKEGKKRLFQVLHYEKGTNLEIFDSKVQIVSPFPPVVALSQGVKNWFPYKTVGEFLLLDSFLAFFFAEEGEFKCSQCGKFSKISSLNQLFNWYSNLKEGNKFYFLLPLSVSSSKDLEYLVSQGWTKFIINDKEVDLSEEPIPPKLEKVYLLLDRLVKEEKGYERLLEDVRQSVYLNKGKVVLKVLDGDSYFFNFKSNCSYCGAELITYWVNCPTCKGLGYKEKMACSLCKGLKLHPLVLESKLWKLKLEKILTFTLKEFSEFLKEICLEKTLKEKILEKLQVVWELGLENLRVFQPVFELSVGERKLLELLLIFSLDLNHCLYILDEPSLGLDLERRERIIKFIRKIIAKKNSVLLVEHDPFFISQADFIIELGPEGGDKGGYLIKTGYFLDFLEEPLTLTGSYLKGKRKIEVFFKSDRWDKIFLKWEEQELELIRGGINLIYGKTGSGKTKVFKNLIEILKKEGANLIEVEEELTSKGRGDLVITYTGIWQDLREIFIQLPSAKIKGLTKSHFSFFTKEGSCPNCKGRGKKIWEEENFYLKVVCEECLGKRLISEVLNLEYKGFKIAELFEFSVKEALEIFKSLFKVKKKLELMKDLGLSYLKLGQEIESLSGGEFSRLSIVRKLSKKNQIDYLFLSFPLQGLHLKDIEDFIKWLESFLKREITVVILETNPFSIFLSQWIVEIEEGKIKFQGKTEEWLNTLKNEEKEKIIEFYGKFFNFFKN